MAILVPVAMRSDAAAPAPGVCDPPAVVARAAAALAWSSAGDVGVSAAEDYRQQFVGLAEPDRAVLPPITIRDDIRLPPPPAAAIRPTTSRRIRAAFLFVSSAGRGWSGYRAVRTVDGRPPADAVVAAAPTALDAVALAGWRRRSADGQRHLLGPIARQLNVPTAALAALHPAHRDRFVFTAAPAALRGTCRVRFQETEAPTILQSGIEDDVPASGLFDVDSATGRVVQSELMGANRASGVASRTTVRYIHDPRLQLSVPREMREEFAAPTGERVRGVARYSGFAVVTSAVDRDRP